MTKHSATRSRPSAANFFRTLEVTPGFAAGLGLLLCLDPANLCLPFLLAAAVHETGHLLCLAACGIPLTHLRIGALGAEMTTLERSERQELLCAAAGPAMNLLTGLLLRSLSIKFSFLSLLLALVNLLPVYPLDGGRMLCVLLPGQAERISCVVVGLLTAAGCVLTARLHWGLWPVLLLFTLFAKTAVCRLREQKLIANRTRGLYNRGEC